MKIATAAALLLGTSAVIQAQTWTVLNLHPAGAESSSLASTTGTQQAGEARINGETHGAIWSGSAGSFQDLHPDGSPYSSLVATSGARQAGNYDVGSFRHAAIWNGTKKPTDLNPSFVGVSQSVITCGIRAQEGGYLAVGAETHAAYWDEKNLCHDLNPAGRTYSQIYALSSNHQGGGVGQVGHAALWSGTKAFVDLNPTVQVNNMPVAALTSSILGMNGTQQVGFAYFMEGRAALWTGTAASFVDLHPTKVTATASALFGTSGARQVGYATIGGKDHAGIWAGTAASFVDLHGLLPAGYESSQARGIWTDGTTTLVAGYAKNATTGQNEAILWKLAPTPKTPPTTPPVTTPKLSITGAKKITTKKTKLTVKGEATSVVTSVTYRIGSKHVKTAGGTTTWKFTAALRPGKNKIAVTAHGPGGDSKPANLTIIRRP